MKTFRQFILEMDPKVKNDIKPQIIRVERPNPSQQTPKSSNITKDVGSVLGGIRALRSGAPGLAGLAVGHVLSNPPNPTGDATLDAAKKRGDYKYQPKNPNGPIGKGGEKHL